MPAGRPTDYRPEYVDQVEGLCKLGATDEDIANFFDVCVSTIDTWKNKYPEFLGAIRNGKELADIRVAEALYKKATGYTYETEAPTRDGPVKLTQYAHPDTAAAFIWLKNRRRDKWSDTRREEISGPDGKPIEVNATDEINRRIAGLAQRARSDESPGGSD